MIVKGATTNHLSSNGDSNVNFNTNRNISKIYDGFANISHAKIKSENGSSNPNTGGNTKINCKLIKLNLSSVSELKDKKDFLNFWRCINICHDVLMIETKATKQLSGAS